MPSRRRDKEASILTDASKLPDVMKFHDLMDFDQRLTAAMSEERRAAGETPAWARMSQLKGSVQDTINTTRLKIRRSSIDNR